MKPQLFKFTLKSGKEVFLRTTNNPIPHFVKGLTDYKGPRDIFQVVDASPVFVVLMSEIASIELMSQP